MKYQTCSVCGNHVPINSILAIDQIIHCEDCVKQKFPSENDLKGKIISKEFDPTVCAYCANDHGEVLLNKMGEYPICATCEKNVHKRIFPKWVKAFFAGVIALVILSSVVNWRFLRAYFLHRKTEAVFATQNAEKIAAHFSELSANVPEIKEFGTIALYNAGIDLMSQDRSEEAIQLFARCTDLPSTYQVNMYMQQAKVGAAFEKKDYHQFLIESKRFLLFDSSAVTLAQIASAYSCLFATQKSDSTLIQANEYILKAKANDTEQSLTNYLNMIRYRLTTGDIVTYAQFEAKFPNGWPQ
jgi:hypothetical protein